MGRMSMSESERESKLREMEADLDSELGLDSVSVSETVPTKRAKGHELHYGKIALGALATFLVTKFLAGVVVRLLLGASVIAFVIFGILWVIGQFRD